MGIIVIDLNFGLSLRFSVPFVIHCSGFCIDFIALHLYCENVCSTSCLVVFEVLFHTVVGLVPKMPFSSGK